LFPAPVSTMCSSPHDGGRSNAGKTGTDRDSARSIDDTRRRAIIKRRNIKSLPRESHAPPARPSLVAQAFWSRAAGCLMTGKSARSASGSIPDGRIHGAVADQAEAGNRQMAAANLRSPGTVSRPRVAGRASPIIAGSTGPQGDPDIRARPPNRRKDASPGSSKRAQCRAPDH